MVSANPRWRLQSKMADVIQDGNQRDVVVSGHDNDDDRQLCNDDDVMMMMMTFDDVNK